MTTATRVTYTNFLSEPRTNIVALLENRTNVADPTGASTSTRAWIHAREPDIKEFNFKDFPFLIVWPATARFPRVGGRRSLNMKKGTVANSILVEVVTCDRAWNNRDGKGLADLDAISDDVVQTLNDTTNRTTLQTNGLFSIELDAGETSVEEFSKTLVYRRPILVSFETRKTVSA